MASRPLLSLLLALAALAWAPGTHARTGPKTVCTITVNSADEKDTFKARLPVGEYTFVELVEKGRPDWLRSACTRQVQCDMLVVSGHFNAGDDFYSDQLGKDEFLRMDELERASCSESCPGLFSRLKEVFLFGCESLNPDASHNGTGESGRERMRRVFTGVPSIYGFSSSAPVGPTAAMLLNRYFDGGGGGALASGRPDSKMLAVFARNSMTRTNGVQPGDPQAVQRQQVCSFFDERRTAAQKLGFVQATLRDGRAPAFLERIEKLLAQLPESERDAPAFREALAKVSADDVARDRFLASTRETDRPARRARMLALAETLGWLSPEQLRAEHGNLLAEVLSKPAVGFGEIDLACTLNRDRSLDAGLATMKPAGGRQRSMGHTAVLACLGDTAAHVQVLQGIASAEGRDGEAAQAYLRHRPIEEPGELRQVARRVAQMPASPAKVKALDTLGRLNIADPEVLRELADSFAVARSLQVQRALAELFIRSDPRALPRTQLAGVLRDHRVRAPGGGEDLIDVLLRRLQGT